MSEMASSPVPGRPPELSIEERLRGAYSDAMESLKLLEDRLSSILERMPEEVNIAPMKDSRTPVEGAVVDLEHIGPAIRALLNRVVI
jgi:hypothetical protein